MNSTMIMARGVRSSGYALGPYAQFQSQRSIGQTQTPAQHDVPRHRQWPWRTLAFASDFGILAHLIKKPKWGIAGWFIAIPYYAYGLAIQPTKKARQEEAIYQATANGVFPFLNIKLGTLIGGKLAKGMAAKWLWPMKALGGIAALAVLTPKVGDPIGEALIEKFRKRHPADKTQPIKPLTPAPASQTAIPIATTPVLKAPNPKPATQTLTPAIVAPPVKPLPGAGLPAADSPKTKAPPGVPAEPLLKATQVQA